MWNTKRHREAKTFLPLAPASCLPQSLSLMPSPTSTSHHIIYALDWNCFWWTEYAFAVFFTRRIRIRLRWTPQKYNFLWIHSTRKMELTCFPLLRLIEMWLGLMWGGRVERARVAYCSVPVLARAKRNRSPADGGELFSQLSFSGH